MLVSSRALRALRSTSRLCPPPSPLEVPPSLMSLRRTSPVCLRNTASSRTSSARPRPTLCRNTARTTSASSSKTAPFRPSDPSTPCPSSSWTHSANTSRRTSARVSSDLPTPRAGLRSYSSRKRTVHSDYVWTTGASIKSLGRIGIRSLSSRTSSTLRGRLGSIPRSTSDTPTTSFGSPPETSGSPPFGPATARSNGASCPSDSPTLRRPSNASSTRSSPTC